MTFIIFVTLYTSRVVLEILGVEDYGIYNVVGGFVTMFGFLNTAMSSATQRYITFSIGKGDKEYLKKVFSNCVFTHALISIVVLVLSETIGLWFLYNKMIIPDDRVNSAFWVYQCSILSTIVLIMSVPYNADIIAHERMSAFAYISILEVIAKLAIVYVLSIGTLDKLIIYAILLLFVQCLIRYIYSSYCRKHFVESKLIFVWDSKLFKEMLSFAGWNLWGGVSNVLYTQGVNVLLNLFFGPTVNAARGVAVQVQSAVSQFANSFQVAINPQITKSYAQHDLIQMHKLVFRSSKFTFILLFVMSLPIFMETNFILTLWLKIVPEWSVEFLRLMLCIIIIDAVANPFMVSVAATGKVKLYQSIIGGTMILIVPTAYIFLEIGGNPTTVFIVHISFCLLTFVMRLFITRPLINFKIYDYFKASILPCLYVFIPSLLCSYIFSISVKITNVGMNSILIIITSCVFALFFSYSLGLTKRERELVASKLNEVMKKIKK